MTQPIEKKNLRAAVMQPTTLVAATAVLFSLTLAAGSIIVLSSVPASTLPLFANEIGAVLLIIPLIVLVRAVIVAAIRFTRLRARLRHRPADPATGQHR